MTKSATISSALPFAVIAALAGFALAGFAPQLFNDGDSWWHIAAGSWMLDHHAVLYRDVFSFTFQGQPWDAQEWLSEILMALAFRLGGWSGLHVLFGLCFGTAAALVATFVRARVDVKAALVTALLGLACTTGGLLARPHLLALPLVALWTLELVRAREQDRAPGWWMACVMLLWANLHGSFAFGLVLATGFAMEAMLARWSAWKIWLPFLGVCVVTAAITPQGLDGLLFPFKLLLKPGIGQIGEWAPTDLTRSIPFALCLALLLIGVASRRLKLPLLRALMLLGLIYLGLTHARHQLLFGIVVPLLLAPSLGQIWPVKNAAAAKWWLPLGAALLALLIVVRLALPVIRSDDRVTPVTALASVPTALRGQPVLNAYDFGGYLIFQGVPVFIDGRTDMYGDVFLTNYDIMVKPDRTALAATLARWHIAWTILPPGPAATMMDTMPGWHRSYADTFAVVDVRNP